MYLSVSVGSFCKTAGWGKIANNRTVATTLREVYVPVVELKSCVKNYKDNDQRAILTNQTFCAGLEGKDSCQVCL